MTHSVTEGGKVYELANFKTDKVVYRHADRDTVWRWAQDNGYLQPAGEDEGGFPPYMVPVEHHVIRHKEQG